MAQLFEKALIFLIATILASFAIGGIQRGVEKIEAYLVAGSCEALASKLVESSYVAIMLGKAEVVIDSPREMVLTFRDHELTVSSHGYEVNRNLPVRASEFSITFSGRCRIVLEFKDGTLWVGGAQW